MIYLWLIHIKQMLVFKSVEDWNEIQKYLDPETDKKNIFFEEDTPLRRR